jgi:hypothetical protein
MPTWNTASSGYGESRINRLQVLEMKCRWMGGMLKYG